MRLSPVVEEIGKEQKPSVPKCDMNYSFELDYYDLVDVAIPCL